MSIRKLATSTTLTVFAALVLMAGGVQAANAVKIHFDKDAIKPNSTQEAAIRRAAASDLKDFDHPRKDSWTVVQADLDDDGHPDLLVRYDDMGFCGSMGCSGIIVMATAHGYAGKPIDHLPNFGGTIDVLASKHHGMHDLHFDDASHVFKWDGTHYR